MTLADWQERLHVHYESLHKARSRYNRPIFALEHGLAEHEIHSLELDIRSWISQSPPDRKHGLAWIVYASESGYKYEGDQYWQSFESKTPGWSRGGNSYRNWMRQCFRSFQEDYGGAQPVGPWAEHFSIICWPITNALLPKDLQYQFARVLNDLSATLLLSHFETTDLLGRRIAAYSMRSNKRFRYFVHETELVGQIAVALLMPDEADSRVLILPATLTRIVEDLETERQSREWLKSARQRAKEVRVSGARAVPRTRVSLPVTKQDWQEELRALSLELTIVLSPSSETEWSVFLRIPDFSPLAKDFPELQAPLSAIRCCVAGSALKSLMARGRLLCGTQTVRLERWPTADSALLEFEKPIPALSALVRTSCLIRPGPDWLFQVGADGLAHEMRGRSLRANHKYLLVRQREDQPDLGPHMRKVSIECNGITAIEIDVPGLVEGDFADQIAILGLSQTKNIRVWPAGIPVGAWDGEGYAEWLMRDKVLIGISSDHDIHRIDFAMNNESDLASIKEVAAGAVYFLELPALQRGSHNLQFRVYEQDDGNCDAAGEFDVVIREPRVFAPGFCYQGPLYATVDPLSPTLENLWEEKMSIHLHGPKDRFVDCSVRLAEKHSTVPLFARKLKDIPLPLDPETWRQLFHDQIRELDEAKEQYDLAEYCDLHFDGSDMGSVAIKCEREYRPLRWRIIKKKRDYRLYLLDDSGQTAPPVIRYSSYELPDTVKQLQNADVLDELLVDDNGGLFSATNQTGQDSILVPPRIKQLADFHIDPQVRERTNAVKDILEMIHCYSLWASANVPGNIAALVRQRYVLKAIHSKMIGLMCGGRWAAAEGRFKPESSTSLEQLLAEIRNKELEKVLRHNGSLYSELNTYERVAALSGPTFRNLLPPQTRLAVSFHAELLQAGFDPQAWQMEFALRLASRPDGLQSWAECHFHKGTEWIREFPAPLRVARYVVLTVDADLQEEISHGWRVYTGWDWE